MSQASSTVLSSGHAGVPWNPDWHPHTQTWGGNALNQTLYSEGFYTAQTHIPSPCTAPPSPTPRGLHRERLGGHRDPPGVEGGRASPPHDPALRAPGAPRVLPCSPGAPGRGQPLVSKVQPGLSPAPPQ